MNRDAIPNPQSDDYHIMRIALGNQEMPDWSKAIPHIIPPGWRSYARWVDSTLHIGIERDEVAKPAPKGAVDLSGKSIDELKSMAGRRSMSYDKNVTKTDLIAMLSQ
jgi:hypothetical protein